MLVYRAPKDNTPQSNYAMMTVSYVGAMLASNQALQYVSYPTQVWDRVKRAGIARAHGIGICCYLVI